MISRSLPTFNSHFVTHSTYQMPKNNLKIWSKINLSEKLLTGFPESCCWRNTFISLSLLGEKGEKNIIHTHRFLSKNGVHLNNSIYWLILRSLRALRRGPSISFSLTYLLIKKFRNFLNGKLNDSYPTGLKL